jgi:hypothetical protein
MPDVAVFDYINALSAEEEELFAQASDGSGLSTQASERLAEIKVELDRCYDLRVHQSPSTSSVVLEYSSEGRVVATGQPYNNRYISVVVIKDRKVTAWRDYLDPLRVLAALEGRPFEPDAFAATDP